jgi:hypothetical protein
MMTIRMNSSSRREKNSLFSLGKKPTENTEFRVLEPLSRRVYPLPLHAFTDANLEIRSRLESAT